MSDEIKSIGVLTGGGDAPGLNAVIRAVTKTAINRYGWSVIGIEDGFEGLLGQTMIRPLTLDSVRGLLPLGGTILGATSRGHFSVLPPSIEDLRRDPFYKEAIDNLARLGIDALIVIGGDGSQSIAYNFHQLGTRIVGVPKTIDNDLAGTELTFGFITALSIATEAIDRLHTTAESHDRVIVIEVMGRNTGWIAVQSGLAGGADVILIPEIPFSIEKVVAKIIEREQAGRKFSIVVVAEGAFPAGGSRVYQTGGKRLGGIGQVVADDIERLTGKETRVVVLGHLQRGGQPKPFDRLLASSFGSAAVDAVAGRCYGCMVALRAGEVVTIPLSEAVGAIKTVPPRGYLVRTARNIGVCFGD